MVSLENVKSVTLLKGYKGLKSEAEMEHMKASFDGSFPDFSLPNPESGLSWFYVVTFHLFNSFNTSSYVLRNSQCKLRV